MRVGHIGSGNMASALARGRRDPVLTALAAAMDDVLRPISDATDGVRQHPSAGRTKARGTDE
jgi:hypothetical protein